MMIAVVPVSSARNDSRPERKPFLDVNFMVSFKDPGQWLKRTWLKINHNLDAWMI